MKRSPAERAALFFSLALGSERLAIYLTQQALNRLQRSHQQETISENLLISEILYWFKRAQTLSSQESESEDMSELWQCETTHATQVEQAARWRKFRNKVSKDELVAVLLLYVLDFSEESVASALRVTPGSLHHRASRGLRVLGRLNRSVAAHG